jgi:hypothetical protein
MARPGILLPTIAIAWTLAACGSGSAESLDLRTRAEAIARDVQSGDSASCEAAARL